MTGPGLAVERTVLAWTRTWLSAAVCALLLLRLSGSGPRLVVTAVLAAAAPAVLAWTGYRRAGRLLARAGVAPPAPVDPVARAVAATAAIVTLLGLVAAVLVSIR